MKTFKAKNPKIVTLRLALDVTYALNGESVEAMRENLAAIATDAANWGTMTGDGPAEVKTWKADVIMVDPAKAAPIEAVRDWLEGDLEAAEEDPDGETTIDLATLRARLAGLKGN